MIQFQIRRVLADADLGTPTGRDKALEEARGLIAATPERTAMRDELVREIADRLDVPADYVLAARTGAAASSSAPRRSAGKIALGAEQEFLASCLASAELGHRYLALAADDQFSSETILKAREHLAAHFEDPLVGLPEDDPGLGELVNQVVQAALAQPPKPESTLRTSILQLEGRRIDREIRRAAQEGDHARQTELAAAAQRVREEMGQIVGQTA
jgi:DNA primase